MCLKKEKMNERKESERCSSFEALVCFFCGFSRDACLDEVQTFIRLIFQQKRLRSTLIRIIEQLSSQFSIISQSLLISQAFI